MQNGDQGSSDPGHGSSMEMDRLGPSSGAKASSTHRRRSQSISGSVRSTIFPAGDVRNNDPKSIIQVTSDMMVNHLYEQQRRKQYANAGEPFEGVVLKVARGEFTCCPPQMTSIPDSLYDMVVKMNVRCAMTVNTPAVRNLLELLDGAIDYVPLPDGLRVQIGM